MASSPHVKKTKIQTGEDHKAGSIYKGEQLMHQKTVLHYIRGKTLDMSLEL